MVKPNDIVTVVDNETGEKTTGKIIHYTKEVIMIQHVKIFDAESVHFEKGEKQID